MIVVGSGPGGLQTSYLLRARGIDHAVLSQDEGPAGMFRRFPLFERLITWSKPYSTADPASPTEYLRYDWNALLVEGNDAPLHVAEFMEGPTYFPSRGEMEASLTAFAERNRVAVRYGCRWEGTERLDDGFRLHTSDGEYEADAVVFAIGSATPWRPSTPGLEGVPHYGDIEDLTKYTGKRVFIVGKRNAAFEVGDGLLAKATQIILASPRPVNLSIISGSTAGARARYLQVYEDAILGGGTYVLDAALELVERTPEGGYTVSLQGTTIPGPLTFSVDEVIAATGWSVPLLDLADLGVATFRQGRLPSLTPAYESQTVPGIYFGGTVTMGAVGLKKHGHPSSSAAVHGFRYNCRILVDHLAETKFGWTPTRPEVDPERLPELIARASAVDGALWNQQAYLTHVFEVGDGVRDGGIQSLQAFVDADGPDAVAATVEMTADGAVCPVIYVRRGGALEEHKLHEDVLMRFGEPEYRAEIARIVKGVVP